LTLRQHIGWLEGTALALLAGVLVMPWLRAGVVISTLVNAAFVITAGAVALKYARIGIRQAIWRLRNRLIVVYAFIAVVPILLLSVLAVLATWEMTGQTAVHLITGEFDRRVNDLAWLAGSIAKAAPARREALLEEGSLTEDRFPGLTVLVEGRQPFRYPPDTSVAPPPTAWGNASGIVVRDQMLYAWARVARGSTLVTVSAPLTREFLRGLVPGLGQVSLVSFAVPDSPLRVMRLHGGGDDPPLPRAASRFDVELFWGVPVRVGSWTDPDASENALFSVRYRVSSILRIVFGQKGDLEQSWQFTPHFRFEPRVRISWMLVRINIDRGLKAAKTPAEDSTQWVTNKTSPFSSRSTAFSRSTSRDRALLPMVV